MAQQNAFDQFDDTNQQPGQQPGQQSENSPFAQYGLVWQLIKAQQEAISAEKTGQILGRLPKDGKVDDAQERQLSAAVSTMIESTRKAEETATKQVKLIADVMAENNFDEDAFIAEIEESLDIKLSDLKTQFQTGNMGIFTDEFDFAEFVQNLAPHSDAHKQAPQTEGPTVAAPEDGNDADDNEQPKTYLEVIQESARKILETGDVPDFDMNLLNVNTDPDEINNPYYVEGSKTNYFSGTDSLLFKKLEKEALRQAPDNPEFAEHIAAIQLFAIQQEVANLNGATARDFIYTIDKALQNRNEDRSLFEIAMTAKIIKPKGKDKKITDFALYRFDLDDALDNLPEHETPPTTYSEKSLFNAAFKAVKKFIPGFGHKKAILDAEREDSVDAVAEDTDFEALPEELEVLEQAESTLTDLDQAIMHRYATNRPDLGESAPGFRGVNYVNGTQSLLFQRFYAEALAESLQNTDESQQARNHAQNTAYAIASFQLANVRERLLEEGLSANDLTAGMEKELKKGSTKSFYELAMQAEPRAAKKPATLMRTKKADATMDYSQRAGIKALFPTVEFADEKPQDAVRELLSKKLYSFNAVRGFNREMRQFKQAIGDDKYNFFVNALDYGVDVEKDVEHLFASRHKLHIDRSLGHIAKKRLQASLEHYFNDEPRDENGKSKIPHLIRSMERECGLDKIIEWGFQGDGSDALLSNDELDVVFAQSAPAFVERIKNDTKYEDGPTERVRNRHMTSTWAKLALRNAMPGQISETADMLLDKIRRNDESNAEQIHMAATNPEGFNTAMAGDKTLSRKDAWHHKDAIRGARTKAYAEYAEQKRIERLKQAQQAAEAARHRAPAPAAVPVIASQEQQQEQPIYLPAVVPSATQLAEDKKPSASPAVPAVIKDHALPDIYGQQNDNSRKPWAMLYAAGVLALAAAATFANLDNTKDTAPIERADLSEPLILDSDKVAEGETQDPIEYFNDQGLNVMNGAADGVNAPYDAPRDELDGGMGAPEIDPLVNNFQTNGGENNDGIGGMGGSINLGASTSPLAYGGSFGEAFAAARDAAGGPDGVFVWEGTGKEYTTEWRTEQQARLAAQNKKPRVE